VLDGQRLRVRLTERRQQVPREFADPAFAVVGEPDFSGWPLGSSPHRPSGPTREAGPVGDVWMITAYPVHVASWTVLRFRVAAGVDPRSLLDSPVDLLITNQLKAEEASQWPDFDFRLLPWQKIYVLTSPSEHQLEALKPLFPVSRRDALARDVLRTAARGAAPPTWWDESESCGLAFSPGQAHRPEQRVVFDAADLHARALAERVVALSADPLHAEGLAPGAFASSLRQANDLLYVFALPSQVVSPCAEMQDLFQKAPWIPGRSARQPGSPMGIRELSLETRLLPLVETRPILMARRGLVGIDIGADGTLWLERLGWSRAGGAP